MKIFPKIENLVCLWPTIRLRIFEKSLRENTLRTKALVQLLVKMAFFQKQSFAIVLQNSCS